MPFHPRTLKLGTPLSAAVGTSGKSDVRAPPKTAKPRMAPPLIWLAIGATISTATSISPERKAVTSAGVPLKGTTCASMPALLLNIWATKF